ncbi:hypothetical protein [Rhodoplanes sp. SY1]|uniref:hypothetical protein n=1 Tax=Rhodoplanes sp. SY1 TaxID=3166646 RepID=UPI0038B4DCEF
MFVALSTHAHAACYGSGRGLSSDAVANFLANPGTLLTDNPDGGARLISQARDLVATDPNTLSAVVALLGSANRDQQRAIGSGLGQAYRICLTPDQAFATQIQQAIAASASDLAKDSYALVNPDVPIGAAGGGGGGGGGGAGGTGGGGPTTTTPTTGVGTVGFALGTTPAANTTGNTLTGGRAGGASGLSAPNSVVSPVQ